MLKYNWYFNDMNNKDAMNVKLQNFEKFEKYMVLIANKFNYFQNFFLIFAAFVRKTYVNYNQKM